MNTPDISTSGILAGLLLIVPTVVLVWKLKLGFNQNLLVAVARMLVQLGFVALYLLYIFKLDNLFINLAYVCMMVFFAALSGIKNAALHLKRFLVPTFISMLVPTLLALIYFNLAILQIDEVFRADILIPIGGLMLGNILKSNIVALKTFFLQARKEEKTYLYLLAAGATRREALRPFFKEAVRTAMAPNIATMATAGLVSLPGVMTGQILGGSDPALAVKYQIMVMIMIFFTGLLSILLQLWLAMSIGFHRNDRLDKSLLRP